MSQGKKRACLVHHRRSGKTTLLVNYSIGEMASNPDTLVYHCFPTYSQGVKVVWQKNFLKYFPASLIKKINNSDMTIEFTNGSKYMVIGSDKYDSLAGTNPNIVIFDEWSLCDPDAYNLIFSPILTENKGIAIFAFTPRGRNHAFNTFMKNNGDEDWFIQKLTIDQTRREDGTPIISQKDIEKARKEGISENKIQQEYYCSFFGSIDGAYYSAVILQAEQEGRIRNLPYDKTLPVSTFFDLGFNDHTSIWFAQRVAQEIRVIDYYANRQQGLDHYAKILKEKPYVYEAFYFPHDIAVSELGTGKTRKDIAEGLGLKPIRVVQRPQYVMNGIEAVRSIFNRCYFDEEKCRDGLNALKCYAAKVNEQKEIIEDQPIHNWASHPSDAFRYLALSDFTTPTEEYKWQAIKIKGTWGHQQK